MKPDGLNGEKYEWPEKFKVFYFLDGDHRGIDEPQRKWELIMARNEDEAERLFKILYYLGPSDNKVSFGWVEEVVP